MPRISEKNLISLDNDPDLFNQTKHSVLRVGNFSSKRFNIVLCVLVASVFFFKNKHCTKYKRLILNKKRHYNQRQFGLKFLRQYPRLKTLSDSAIFIALQTIFQFKFRIIVFVNNQKNNIIFSGNSDASNSVFICEDKNRKGFYYILKKPGKYFGFRSFCSKCVQFAYNKKNHFCVPICPKCFESNCSYSGQYKYCDKCNRFFLSKICFNNHITNKTCDNKHKCLKCKKEYIPNKIFPHVCQNNRCDKCYGFHEIGRCFVRTGHELGSNTLSIPIIRKIIYFDIETVQCNDGELKPILLVAYYLCSKTLKFVFRVFNSSNVIKDFIDFLFQYNLVSKKFIFQNYIVMAHNFKGFDGIFIINELHNRMNFKLDVIYDGTKLQTLTIKKINIKFLDSMNFIQTSLRSMSQMFGQKQSKSFFPYALLTPDLINYKAYLPEKKYYEFDQLKEDEQIDFHNFYEKQKRIYGNGKKIFDLKKVLLNYCKQDCIVLANCMEEFRKLVLLKTKFDPFEKDLTLPGVALRDFIFNYLQPHSLSIIPARGYFASSNQSYKALEYIAFRSFQLKTNFQTVKHKLGEYKIGQFQLDGISHEKKLVIQYMGCFFHGCPTCFHFTDYNSFKNTSMKTLYLETKNNEMEIKYLMKTLLPKYTMETIWEHNHELLKKSDYYKSFLKSNYTNTLNSKTDATISERGFFYGGRVNCLKFYLKNRKSHEIRYYDIISLYPYVCKYKSYPKGQPEIIQENFNKSHGFYYGIMKCKLLPPRKLFHPIIPSRINNKLIFTLCRTCAETYQKTNCYHQEEERCLYGEWGTPEVYRSLELGYKLKEIYCVIHYKERFEYENENQSGLFGGYINNWLKEKVQASDYPQWVKSEQDKIDYIESYFQQEGIRLDKNKIKLSPGERSLAKLLLNSVYGKISMGINKPKTIFIDQKDQFVNMMMDDTYDIKYYDIINENRLMINFVRTNAGIETNYKGNPIVGSYVTMWARMILVEVLLILGDRVAYFDTDSIIFTQKPGEYEPLLGDKLGDWSNEIPDGVKILEFVATGPKSYSLKLSNGKSIVKVKGITRNYSNREKISFDSLKKSVFIMTENKSNELTDGIIVTNKLHFCRDKVKSKISNKPMSKKLSFKYTKRVKYSNKNDPFITYPFGYQFD